MADITESLIDERKELMVSPNSGRDTTRDAHFLKPTFTPYATENERLLPHPLLLLPLQPTFDQLTNFRLECCKGYPTEKWKIWVDILKPKCQQVWKKAGIYEAILASTYNIPRDENLVVGLAERWCCETNTFIFSWGEVTITLEDVIQLGNYSVLGIPDSSQLPEEMVDSFDVLRSVLRIARLDQGASVSNRFIEYFMGTGKPSEHGVFLAYWLAKFVLVRGNDCISLEHIRVATHLSHGTRIALAPVVLASMYRDMRELSKEVADFRKQRRTSKVTLKSVNHTDLLHMWAWERFDELRPIPNAIQKGEPRSARWNDVTTVKVKDVRAALNSAKKSFLWRPYTMFMDNCTFPELYAEEESVVVESEKGSLVRCLRVSELVDSGYIEPYRPNRVTMQFGLDQDIPAYVIRSYDPEAAWRNYNRPTRDVKLYIPHRNFESDVSSQYDGWWDGHFPVDDEDAQRSPVIPCSCLRDSVPLPTRGCATKRPRKIDEEYDNLTIAQYLSRPRMRGSYRNRNDADREPEDDVAVDSLTINQLLGRLRKRGSYTNRNDTNRETEDDLAEDSLTIAQRLGLPRKMSGNVGVTEPGQPAENAVLRLGNNLEVIVIDSSEEESSGNQQDYTSDI